MTNGRKCHAPALRGKPYCYFHARLHGLAVVPSPTRARARISDKPVQLPLLEDRNSIRIALAQVSDALRSAQLDPRRAGLMLYALQIASQNLEREPTSL